MPELLDAHAVATRLRDLDGWVGDTREISRTVELADFAAAIAVVNRVAEVAEEMNHHPDIDIRWATLTFRCATHSMGGVTGSDFELAGRIDGVVSDARRST